MDPEALVARNVRRLREQQGLSQEELADLAKLHRNYVGRVELHKASPTVRALSKLARALGVEMKMLFTEQLVVPLADGKADTSMQGPPSKAR